MGCLGCELLDMTRWGGGGVLWWVIRSQNQKFVLAIAALSLASVLQIVEVAVEELVLALHPPFAGSS
jgi:hypothetical protein